MSTIEATYISISALCLLIYFLRLVHQCKHAPDRTVIGLGALSRRRWVESVIGDKRDILAVQTLRNWSMSANMFASTAIFLGIGLMGFLVSSDRIIGLENQLDMFGLRGDSLVPIKIACLVILLLVAFFNFAIALRFFNHVSLDINAPFSEDRELATEAIRLLLDRATLHNTLGMRCYYLTLPVITWFFGPLGILLGTLATIALMYRLDYLKSPGR